MGVPKPQLRTTRFLIGSDPSIRAGSVLNPTNFGFHLRTPLSYEAHTNIMYYSCSMYIRMFPSNLWAFCFVQENVRHMGVSSPTVDFAQ
jgi:hypothetical protein